MDIKINKYLPLTECLEKIIDNRGKSVPISDKGIPLIATNCIDDNTLYPNMEKIRYISEKTYESWFKDYLQPDDIIFVNKGTPGKVNLCPNPLNFMIAQDAIGLRCNKDIVYSKYLFYVLRSPEIKRIIANNNVGLIIPHFKKEFLSRIMIPIIDMKKQKEIGDLLFAIDSQIERNNGMCQKLQCFESTISCFLMRGEMRYAS